jgi:hypothetical protein
MSERERPYLAYLLRLWQVAREYGTGRRASLENAHSGERRGFASLEELFAFLWAKTSAESGEWKGEKR